MSDHLSDVFRMNVYAALRWRGWTQGRLADAAGVTTDNLSKLLRNPRGIGVTLATVERYATALGIEPGVLVTPGGVQRLASVRLERAS